MKNIFQKILFCLVLFLAASSVGWTQDNTTEKDTTYINSEIDEDPFANFTSIDENIEDLKKELAETRKKNAELDKINAELDKENTENIKGLAEDLIKYLSLKKQVSEAGGNKPTTKDRKEIIESIATIKVYTHLLKNETDYASQMKDFEESVVFFKRKLNITDKEIAEAVKEDKNRYK